MNPSRKSDQNPNSSSTAMVLVRGFEHKTLNSFIKEKRLQLWEVYMMIKMLAELTNTLHQMGLYHGNISVKSVIVTKTGDVSYI